MKKVHFKKILKKIALVGITISLIVITYNIIRIIVYQPDQKKILDTLKIEFHVINKLPSATVVNEHYACFTDKTGIDINYSTSSSDIEIQKYYDSVLTRNDWDLISNEKIYDWGHDLGGKLFEYKKSKMEFSIMYSGDRKGYGWAYSIHLNMK